MNDHSEAAWLTQLRQQLDQDARDLDAATASRLNRARQQALDAGLRKGLGRWIWLPMAMATTAAAILALTVMLRSSEPVLQPPTQAAASAVDDLELLAGSEELEMIENLEFYAWLEQQSLDG